MCEKKYRSKWRPGVNYCPKCGGRISNYNAGGICRPCMDELQHKDAIRPEDCREECRQRVEHYRHLLETYGVIDYCDPPPLKSSLERRGREPGRRGQYSGRRRLYNSEDLRKKKRRYRLLVDAASLPQAGGD